MIKRCASVYCVDPVSGFSTLCERHKRNQRRHGHAEQKGIAAHELKPFLERIAARRSKNPANPTWQLLRGRWEALTGHAKATLADYASGAVAVSYERQTAEQLVALLDTVNADAVIDVALAMFSMWELMPNRFQSDKAFNFQLSRRVRGLAEVNKGSHYSAVEGRMKRTYTDTPPRVLECLAASLKVAFGVAGMRLAELDKQDAEGVKAEKQQLNDALEDMS
jgi:hypothetical protein